MDAKAFLIKSGAPYGLYHQIHILGLGEDYGPYLEQPEDWYGLNVSQRTLHGLPLLNNAWRWFAKRDQTKGTNRCNVLCDVFPTLAHAAGKITPEIRNPGSYLFSAVRNEMRREIARQSLWLPLQFDQGFDCVSRGFRQIKNESGLFYYFHSELEACCETEDERNICYERCLRVFQGWAAPKHVEAIAKRLDLSPQYVKETLNTIQDRFLAKVNTKKRQHKQKQIAPVELAYVSPGI